MSGGPHVLEPRHIDHVVAFYDDDSDLTSDVARFFADGLKADSAAIIIATPDHRRSFEKALDGHGVPVDRLRAGGRVMSLDARETLTALTVDGRPNREAFLDLLGPIVDGAGAGRRRIRAFGEMVGLLWEQGDVYGAIALESFWNELCGETDLSLYCAYPSGLLTGADLSAVTRICAKHSEVLPPSSYVSRDVAPAGPDDTTERSQLFLPTPRAAGAVRQFVADAFEAWGAATSVFDATVVASELTTNAIRHASSPFRVLLRRTDTSVTISVHDASASRPQQRQPSDDALNGRGLAIVDQLTAQWGTEFTPDGKVVWATMPIPA